MGKMSFGSEKKEIQKIDIGTINERIIEVPVISEELLERIAKLEAKDLGKIEAEAPLASLELPEIRIVEKTIEKVETRTEVSVITKDKRARKHSLLVKEQLDILSHKLKVSDSLHDGHTIEIQDLQQYVLRLEAKLYELEMREKALEAQIPEEKQEVKVPGLVYLGVTAAILLSILGLILK